MNDMRSIDPVAAIPSSLPLKSSKISHTLQSKNLWRPHRNQSTIGFWNWNSTRNYSKGRWFLCWRTFIWLYNLQHGASKTGYHLKLLDSIPSLVKSLVNFLCIHVLKMMLNSPFLLWYYRWVAMIVIGITLYLELAIELGSGESREVDIQGLQVHYVPHMPFVLRRIACTFPRGMKTNIIRTGSGKSTLVQTFQIVEPVAG